MELLKIHRENPKEKKPKEKVKREGITFEDIAGQPEAVEAARMLAMQLRNPERFEMLGVDCPKGVLFTGPPGTGKTLLAKALANECGVPFKAVKASEILSKWFGESTTNIRKEFDALRKDMEESSAEYAVLYIDEIDALAPSRSGSNLDEESRRMLSELLQQVDGFSTKKGIILIASTNTPDAVDNAFLSRMEMTVEMALPNTDGLTEIISLHFTKACVKAKRNIIAADVNFRRIANELRGCSGRDIESIVKTTLRLKAQDELKKDNKVKDAAPMITESDILKGIERTGKFVNPIDESKRKVKHKIGFVIGQ